MKFGKLLCTYGVAVFVGLLVVCLVCVRLHGDALKSDTIADPGDSRISSPAQPVQPAQSARRAYSVRYEATASSVDANGRLRLDLTIYYWDPAVRGNLEVRWVSYFGQHWRQGSPAPASPWLRSFTAYAGDDLGVTAFDNGRSVATVRIYVDDVLVVEDTEPVYWRLE